MNQSEYYKRAIDILEDNEVNYREIAVLLAKDNPSTLVHAHMATHKLNTPAWMHNMDSLIRAGRKIDAIKEHRAQTGSMLKDAKDAVQARYAELGISWVKS